MDWRCPICKHHGSYHQYRVGDTEYKLHCGCSGCDCSIAATSALKKLGRI